ncbi:hypothetical protein BY458DRAFT_530775 [Sporodiniella umbellata]|nr:hypothetical protein BY458DRAFT_530775 [Sporodiniella umbellata]
MSSEFFKEPFKKRTKIMSACAECRRKKTKCNGEQPCRTCSRASTSCVYPTDDKRNVMTRAALEAIEQRLKNIEDMLVILLAQQQTRLPPIHHVSKDHIATSSLASPMKKRKR